MQLRGLTKRECSKIYILKAINKPQKGFADIVTMTKANILALLKIIFEQ